MHRIRLAFATLAFAACASGAMAQSVVTNPSWATVPDADAMSEAYPVFAGMTGLEGDATLTCVVKTNGLLSSCEVSANPEGLGFDRAALSMAGGYRANPREVDGEATQARVQFVVRFRMEPEASPAPWEGPEPSAAHLGAARAYVLMMEMGGPGGADIATLDELETMNLSVDSDREAVVRAMVIQVGDEFRESEVEAVALALARALTPEQLAFLARRGQGPLPPRPSNALFRQALEIAGHSVSAGSRRLRAMYCAQYSCPTLPATPLGEQPQP